MNLRHRGDGGLAAAAAGALLDGDRGRYPIDCIHIGLAGRLDDGARIGVQRLQVAALALVEKNVEGQCGFARARYARDNGNVVARNAYLYAFQIVFTGVDDVYAWRCVAPAFQEDWKMVVWGQRWA